MLRASWLALALRLGEVKKKGLFRQEPLTTPKREKVRPE